MAATIWDPAGSRMVVYGGFGGNGDESLADLWALSMGGSPAWTQLSPAGAWPSPRKNGCGVYDSHDNALVIYGNRDTSGQAVPDLVWSSWMAGAAPGQRSYLSVMMRS